MQVEKNIHVCRDPSDDKFLECAVEGRANYIVSADKDLLDLKIFEGIEIIEAPVFWQKLREEQA